MNEQEFSDRLHDAGWNKKKLLHILNELDEAKRGIKATLRRYAHDPDYLICGRERKIMERKLKDKEGYLIKRREIVRDRLGQIKTDQKNMNKAANSHKGFSDAFVASAERILTEDQFTEIELRAVEIINNDHCNEG